MSSDPHTFLGELKRRRVGRVFLLYGAGSFAVLQGADIVIEALSMPDWVLRTVLIVLALGLPVAMVLAWAFDIDPDPGKSASGDPFRADVVPGDSTATAEATATWVSPASVVAASALILFGVAAGWIFGPLIGGRGEAGGTGVAPDRSIAVLPLQNLSPDPDNQYFADGIHEDVLTHLSKIGGLKVISRTSVLEYRGVERNIPEIAAELGVAAVLEGSVRRDRDRVRITAQLIEAATDEHLWAETYDRTLDDVFAIQEEIARNIAASLAAVLSPEEESSLSAPPPTEDFDAYEQYLRGVESLTRAVFQLDAQILAESIGAFERAVEMDARFGVAWAHLSVAAEWSQRLATDQVERARLQRLSAGALERAVRLGPDLFETLFATALQGSRAPGIHLRAEEDIGYLERALGLNPNSAATLRELGFRHELLGEIGLAAQYAEQAVELEPRSAAIQLVAAGYSRLLRDFEKAERHVRRATSLSSDTPLAAVLLLRERLSLEFAQGGGVARGGGAARADEIFLELGPRLTRSDMLWVLGEFPELMANGDFESLVLSLSPTAGDPDLRCTCYPLKAWAHEVAGRSEAARIYWDSASTAGADVAARLWEIPNADRDRFREATILARAGRVEDATVLLQGVPGPRGDPGPGPDPGERHDTRLALAAAYTALGDVEAAVRQLSHLLSVPSDVTEASLRDRLVWDSIRETPEFQALLGG